MPGDSTRSALNCNVANCSYYAITYFQHLYPRIGFIYNLSEDFQKQQGARQDREDETSLWRNVRNLSPRSLLYRHPHRSRYRRHYLLFPGDRYLLTLLIFSRQRASGNQKRQLSDAVAFLRSQGPCGVLSPTSRRWDSGRGCRSWPSKRHSCTSRSHDRWKDPAHRRQE